VSYFFLKFYCIIVLQTLFTHVYPINLLEFLSGGAEDDANENENLKSEEKSGDQPNLHHRRAPQSED